MLISVLMNKVVGPCTNLKSKINATKSMPEISERLRGKKLKLLNNDKGKQKNTQSLMCQYFKIDCALSVVI